MYNFKTPSPHALLSLLIPLSMSYSLIGRSDTTEKPAAYLDTNRVTQCAQNVSSKLTLLTGKSFVTQTNALIGGQAQSSEKSIELLGQTPEGQSCAVKLTTNMTLIDRFIFRDFEGQLSLSAYLVDQNNQKTDSSQSQSQNSFIYTEQPYKGVYLIDIIDRPAQISKTHFEDFILIRDELSSGVIDCSANEDQITFTSRDIMSILGALVEVKNQVTVQFYSDTKVPSVRSVKHSQYFSWLNKSFEARGPFGVPYRQTDCQINYRAQDSF